MGSSGQMLCRDANVLIYIIVKSLKNSPKSFGFRQCTENKNSRRFNMVSGSQGAGRYQVPFICLVPYLSVAFGLVWGILVLFIFLPDQMTDICCCLAE